MHDFQESDFENVLNEMSSQDVVIVPQGIGKNRVGLFVYFLTRHSVYSVIVDDYCYDIVDKYSLLEALYYQLRLIAVYDLNWDAIEEGLHDAVDIYRGFENVVIVFRRGNELIHHLPKEFNVLFEIIEAVNSGNKDSKIKVVMF